jgi:hypothetical protein
MPRTRNWQVRVTWPGPAPVVAIDRDGTLILLGSAPRVMTFGVHASTRLAARRKARKIAGDDGDLRVTRLYGRHHPLRRAVGREEPDDPGDAALASPGKGGLAIGRAPAAAPPGPFSVW